MSEPNTHRTLRLGTRGSLLAKSQSGWVARELELRHPGLKVELVIVTTSGDTITNQPLHAFGGKGLFTKELEQALLAGKIDFAVHSFKDVPVTMPLVDTSDLIIAAVPPREDARDAWASVNGSRSVDDLPRGAMVGTGSLRRRCQLLARRPDIVVEPIRGNIDTRLRKMRQGQYDAVVLATAGLKRAALFDPAMMFPIEPDIMLPAPGQGALALECRRVDRATIDILQSMNDPNTAACVEAERQVVLGLNGDCHSPIAAWATLDSGAMKFRVAVGGRDGVPPLLTATAEGDAREAVARVLADLRGRGVEALLHG